MKWFKDNTESTEKYTDAQIVSLIQKYLEGKQFELAELKKDEKKNLWKINTLQSTIDRDITAFEQGKFSAPDIPSKKVLSKLHLWDGHNTDYLCQIRLKNFKKEISAEMEA
mmetsp:Transcript_135896/g.202102  ORF Transcript_135896/g.202102 Transcript_135896/m.202102 type:complete len:111 (+) Transcript_135896:157-489(+)